MCMHSWVRTGPNRAHKQLLTFAKFLHGWSLSSQGPSGRRITIFLVVLRVPVRFAGQLRVVEGTRPRSRVELTQITTRTLPSTPTYGYEGRQEGGLSSRTAVL